MPRVNVRRFLKMGAGGPIARLKEINKEIKELEDKSFKLQKKIWPVANKVAKLSDVELKLEE